MTRRLPVYIVVDCSGSMAGNPIAEANRAVQALYCCIMQDPVTIETVWLSVVTFSDSATQISPLTEACDFVIPELLAAGQKRLGLALTLLSECVEREVRKTTGDQRGDWKPLVFLLTDGAIADSWESPVQRIRDQGLRIIGLVCGDECDLSVLKRITTSAYLFRDLGPGAASDLFRIPSSLFGATSYKMEDLATDVPLPPPPPVIIIDL